MIQAYKHKGMNIWWILISLPFGIIGWLIGLIVWSIYAGFMRAKNDIESF